MPEPIRIVVLEGAIYDATLEAAGDGIRTHDLGGQAGTTEVCEEVAARAAAKLGAGAR